MQHDDLGRSLRHATVHVCDPRMLIVETRLTFSSSYLGRRPSASFWADSAAERALTAFLFASSRASLMRCSRLARPSASSFGPLRLASCASAVHLG